MLGYLDQDSQHCVHMPLLAGGITVLGGVYGREGGGGGGGGG